MMLTPIELQSLRNLGQDDAADEIELLREALRLSTNGLRHVSRWNITDETRAAITTQIISNEALLMPNAEAQTTVAPAQRPE